MARPARPEIAPYPARAMYSGEGWLRSRRFSRSRDGIGPVWHFSQRRVPSRAPSRAPLGLPRAAISATSVVNPPTLLRDKPGIAADVAAGRFGQHGAAKPEFCRFLQPAAVCATGRTAPDSEISPK